MDSAKFKTLESNEEKEKYTLELSEGMIKRGDYPGLLNLLIELNQYWKDLTTARLTKIIKLIYEKIEISFAAFEDIRNFLNGLIEWSSEKKMLKLDLECKLINVYLTVGKYPECLKKIAQVSKDLKKYDDKINLISLYVYESTAHYELMDFSRAKSSLTSARAMAVSSACPANLQAQIDLLNGMYLSDEHSFDTAISYFIESMEGFLQDKLYENAKVPLRYMILNKILLSKLDEINTTLENKNAEFLKNDRFVELLCEIASSCKKRDLRSYNDIIVNNPLILDNDQYIKRHLLYLYNILLDKNILKIIEPYSHIKINFIANKLQLSEEIIEERLRKLILDKSIAAIIDHDINCLVLFEEEKENNNLALNDIRPLKEYFSMIK